MTIFKKKLNKYNLYMTKMLKKWKKISETLQNYLKELTKYKGAKERTKRSEFLKDFNTNILNKKKEKI